MKKLFNSRFLFILASSLVVLILLTVGAFYLFEDEDDTFVKSGYVLNPLSSTVEKYFFDGKVGYKENLSSMIEFKDVDENKVTVLKDSFIHYLDESLSFLKNGAILDLDSVRGDKAVAFYNITSDSIIEKDNSGYTIDSAGGEIKLKNFIGRISDNKYIVVGDLSLKMAGNSTSVKGDYFEIVYVEEGVVNIENKDVKYQVTADNTSIYVGNDKEIDLGNKKIIVNGEDVMSITSITINGDENIEIIPKDDEDEDDNSGEGNGNGTGQQGNNTGENGGSNDGEEGNGGTGNPGIDTDDTEEVVVSLKNASVGSTNIDVTFDIVNASEDDKFMLQVVNLTSGRTVDMVAQVIADEEIKVNLLTPNTKYLFIVNNEKDNGKYFQKVLETTGFGIKLEKMYATDSSLAYKVIVDSETDITNAKLTLYKYNEETMQNEVVTNTYVDSTTGEIKTVSKITYLSSIEGNIEGEHEILYDGLDSNTIYTAVLDEFSVASSNFKDIYNITLTSMTLKKIPSFSEMEVSKNVGEGSFDLSLGNINDPDNAIVSYTYLIYDKYENTLAIEPIVRTNASSISVKVGDGENELKNDTNYYYKVIIEYFDNEKYIEYVTSDSIIFMMGNDPYITVVPKEDLISYDRIGATIYLKDTSCLISMPGRKKCSGPSSTVVEVSKVNSVTGDVTTVFSKLVEFEVSEEEIKYELFIDGLEAGTIYNIEVKASYNNSDSLIKQYVLHTDESKRTISTKSLTNFDVEWIDKGSSEINVVNVQSKFLGVEGTGTMSPEESASSIKKVVIKLYEGNNVENLDKILPIATKIFEDSDKFNIKENFYDNGYTISSSQTFGLSMQALKDYNKDGELTEYYTVMVEAYYDLDGKSEVKLLNNILAYKISPVLLTQDLETVLDIAPITNKKAGNIFGNLVNGGTYVGYKISVAFDRAQLMSSTGLTPKKINYYVYDGNKNKLNFYILNKNGELELTKNKKSSIDIVDEGSFFETEIYMDYGTSYEVVDEVMRRGNYFYIGYEIETVDANNKVYLYPTAKDNSSPSEYGEYKYSYAEKETPTLKMYIAKTTADSVIYSYSMKDPDNAVYKDALEDTYGFYVKVNYGDEVKYDMVNVEDASYNQFEGRLTIDGLNSGDIYSVYYKKNSLKSGAVASDVLNYIDGFSSGLRTFDGYYDMDGNVDSYNFKYEIINNPLKDNKVTIKILMNEELLDRVLSYRINFTDSKGNTFDKELWKLSTCDGDSTSSKPRCLSVDYIELKNAGMKSENDEINLIKVNVTALYDNGLTGYDYKVGSAKDADYLYCIMQDNSSDLGMGNYIAFSASGQQVTVWSEAIDAPKGYYTYTLNNSLLFYKSELYPSNCKSSPSSHCSNISVNLSSVGYSSKNGVMNPKMVSVDKMQCSTKNGNGSCNEFFFSSITPKVSVSEKAPIINGSVMNLTLSGIDLSDLKQEDSEYYLYIETWNKYSNVGKVDASGNIDKTLVARPTLKVKIDKANPTSTINAVIDSLKEYNAADGSGTYYFNVYAKMRNGSQYVYTQLFDAGISDKYDVKTYTFKSAKASDLFHSIAVGYTSSDEVYGNRTLNTKINLLAYKNNISFNFDLVYVMCEVDDYKTCGPNDGDTKIFKRVIPVKDISTIIDDSVDISSYDLEFGKKYYMFLYANFNYYDTESQTMTKRDVILNRYNLDVTLKKLTEPSFVVTRNAILDNGEYAIDFNIVVNDADRTLVDGNYFIKLLDSNGNIVGNMKLLDEDGNYYDVNNYKDYAFDAFVVNKKVRIVGLESNKKYTFVVYNDAYLNNYSEDTLPGKEHRTYEVAKSYSVFSTNDYGVAFGDATYGVTEKSVVVTFLGGSNFANVSEVNYTVGLWDDDQSASTVSGTFVIGENNKAFEMYKDSEDWRFVIDPSGMKNVLGKTYKISISFKVKVPGTNQYVVLTSADVPSFEGTVTYYQD